jgi:hypothetical protein
MPFQPNVHDELTIKGVTYQIAEHPAAPGLPYGQEGRAGFVYCLEQLGSESSKVALKVFKPRFRLPFLVSQADQLAKYASLPGLRACRRTVLTPTRHPDLLRQYPELIYAVLMPWIEGPTWFDVLIEKKPLPPETSLSLARSLAQVLVRMEEQGIAHCDLSSSNLMLPILAGGKGVELVDLEGFYGPGMVKPQALSSGSAGYAHKQAVGGLWGPEADRFAGAVLLAEMLGFCDEGVCQEAWGESYFDPAEMQEETNRFRKLIEVLERRWGGSVAHLFERAWKSDSLLDCPTFGEWLVALPEQVAARAVSVSVPVKVGEGVSVPGGAEGSAEIRAFMQAGRRMEEKGNLEGALELYRQALEVAQGDPTLRSLVKEIELTIQDVQERARAKAQDLSKWAEEELAAQRARRHRLVLIWASIASILAIVLVISFLIWGAITGGGPMGFLFWTPTPTPTPTATPTVTPMPTYTPTPTHTFTPTSTPRPTATFTPTPTRTPRPTPRPTNTPTPTLPPPPTPTPPPPPPQPTPPPPPPPTPTLAPP